jgi:hypothetical protein
VPTDCAVHGILQVGVTEALVVTSSACTHWQVRGVDRNNNRAISRPWSASSPTSVVAANASRYRRSAISDIPWAWYRFDKLSAQFVLFSQPSMIRLHSGTRCLSVGSLYRLSINWKNAGRGQREVRLPPRSNPSRRQPVRTTPTLQIIYQLVLQPMGSPSEISIFRWTP